MSTVKFDEARLLGLGLKPVDVAALRRAVNAIGDIPAGTTLASILDQLATLPGVDIGAVESRIDQLEAMDTQVSPGLGQLSMLIDDLTTQIAVLTDQGARISALEQRITDLEVMQRA